MLPRIRQWLIPHGKDAKDNHGPHSDQAKDTSPQPPQINHINTPKPELGNYHGLVNFGNTCYCNSVIQVSLSVKSLLTSIRPYSSVIHFASGSSSIGSKTKKAWTVYYRPYRTYSGNCKNAAQTQSSQPNSYKCSKRNFFKLCAVEFLMYAF